jgi:hypothetical protein
MLQSKAGYIDARPHIRQLDESSLATRGRTIHWGHTRSFDDVRLNVRFAQKRTSVDCPQNAIPVIAVIRGTVVMECSRLPRLSPP